MALDSLYETRGVHSREGLRGCSKGLLLSAPSHIKGTVKGLWLSQGVLYRMKGPLMSA